MANDAKDKVMFGICNVHFGTYEVDGDGNVTLGAPYHVPGSVNLSLEPDSEEVKFYADNVEYWTTYSDNGYTGELENALFDDQFKLNFMNYIQLDDGGIAQLKGVQNKKVYMMFEAETDIAARRCILYNLSLGQITREYATTEASAEPQTAKLPFTVTGDNATKITRVAYKPSDATYDSMFTTPPVPVLPDASE